MAQQITPYTYHRYTRSELVADALVHGMAGLLALVGCIHLGIELAQRPDAALIGSVTVYALGLITMIVCSALYNMTTEDPWKDIFRRCDHAAIFVMIAGTYTPFTLVAIGGAEGTAICVMVWSVAVVGSVFKIIFPRRLETLSIVFYLALGWSVLLVIEPLIAALSNTGLTLLTAGGILYSVGVLVHMATWMTYHNVLWHVFVFAGAGCHYVAVLQDVVQR